MMMFCPLCKVEILYQGGPLTHLADAGERQNGGELELLPQVEHPLRELKK